jgi:2-amino-4-hydroxy-6-hydroxymethyldihydropteridine diphosphokinase
MSSHSNIIRAKLDEVPVLAGAELAYIGIGSNLATGQDEPVTLLQRAFAALALLSDYPVLVSSLWASTPVDCPPGSPRFINAVAALRPRQSSPRQLLASLQQIEDDFGRRRGPVRNAPRTLDLDILSFADVRMQELELTLPHPRMHERAFVLMPLLEITPDYCIPGMKRPASALVREIARQGTLSPIKFARPL